MCIGYLQNYRNPPTTANCARVVVKSYKDETQTEGEKKRSEKNFTLTSPLRN